MIKYFFILFIVFSFTVTLPAQDIFSGENSVKYGKFLYQKGNYFEASREFERVVFLDSGKTVEYQEYLLNSWLRSGNYPAGISWVKASPALFNWQNPQISSLYNDLLIRQGMFDSSEDFIQRNKALGDSWFTGQRIKLFIYSKHWNSAQHTMENPTYSPNPEIRSLVIHAGQINFKEPWKAGVFSAIIPGSGKIYSGAWKDGLFSLIIVGSSAYQSYRGFEKKGTESILGWIYGGLALAFHAGNIYGSVKAAKKYNTEKENEILEKADQIYFRDH